MSDQSPHNARSTSEQKRFQAIGTVSGGVSKRTPRVERLLNRWGTQPDLSDWKAQMSWAQLQQTPLRARTLLYSGLLVVIALIVWAYFAPLEEVTRGEGRVIPSSQLQVVQSLDGGVVQTIEVSEGERVKKGQLLMRLDKTRSLSDVRERQARILNLRAEITRLRAQIDRRPPQFDSELEEAFPQLVSDHQELYEGNLLELHEQQSALREQKIQREQDIEEARSTARQAQSIISLAREELSRKRPMLETGAVSEADILQLERELTRARGELERAETAILRAQAAIREAGNKLAESLSNFKNNWRAELAEAQVRLEALQEEEIGLANRVEQAEIRSPVDGIVQRMFNNTIGGIVLPGHEIIEIVPVDDQLIIEAKISPVDIAFLRPGLPATVKLTAYDFNIFGGLQAELEHISADTITDEDDNTFFLVRLRTLENELSGELPIIPGMTAQVDIITGKKTVLEYLLKPVLRATSEAMRER